jgi:hypothetical protein
MVYFYLFFKFIKIKKNSLLIGAPHSESGQPGTFKAGAIYACDPGFILNSKINGCIRLLIEYPNQEEFLKQPEWLNSKILHSEGKNGQLLGFTVYSTGIKKEENSRALVLFFFNNILFKK